MGALPLWRWHRCKAPKTPYFQRCCHPMTPYFCWLSLLSPKDPTFFVKCGLFNLSHPKTPYFLHSAATGNYFLFQFYRQIDHFCHFRQFSFANSCFWSAHWKIKSNFLTQCPLILNQNLASHPMTPNFLRLCSHRMPKPVFSPNAQAFGSVSLTPITIWYWGAPPPPDFHSAGEPVFNLWFLIGKFYKIHSQPWENSVTGASDNKMEYENLRKDTRLSGGLLS